LVYGYAGALKAVRFDLSRLAVATDPVSVVERVVMLQTAVADFSLSREGTLVYVPGDALTQVARVLTWVSRDGNEEPLKAEPRAYTSARLSPDETRVALAASDEANDVWTYDIRRQSLTRLTTDPNLDNSPIWSIDGRRIVFTSSRSGPPNIYSQPADGTGTTDRLSIDLMLLRFDPKPQAEPLLQTPSFEGAGEVSPDGRSNESGRNEVYVRPFPKVEGGRWPISIAGGSRPAWARNGKELFYLDGTTAMMAVPIQTAPVFIAGTPTKLFDGLWYMVQTTRPYDVSHDGQKFLMIRNAEAANLAAPTMTVVLNWTEELRRLVPGN
jgi:eukaryotic-like serine/threonine-protein kinase